jgi:hypothetical protein
MIMNARIQLENQLTGKHQKDEAKLQAQNDITPHATIREEEKEEEEQGREDEDFLILEELEELHKQVNTDVDNLEHLEQDFRADLKRIGQRLHVLDFPAPSAKITATALITSIRPQKFAPTLQSTVNVEDYTWCDEFSISSSSLHDLVKSWTNSTASSDQDDEDIDDDDAMKDLHAIMLEADVPFLAELGNPRAVSEGRLDHQHANHNSKKAGNPQEPPFMGLENTGMDNKEDCHEEVSVDDHGHQSRYQRTQAPEASQLHVLGDPSTTRELQVEETLLDYTARKQAFQEIIQDEDHMVAPRAASLSQSPTPLPTGSGTCNDFFSFSSFSRYPKLQKKRTQQVHQYESWIYLAIGVVVATLVARPAAS